MSAIRGILRGNNSLFKCMFSCPTPPIEINSAEVLAIYRPIQISIRNDNFNIFPIVIESDSCNAVKDAITIKRGLALEPMLPTQLHPKCKKGMD